MFYKQNEGIRFSAVCLYVFVTKWKLISSQGLIIYSPQLNVTRSIFFFFNRKEKAPSCFLEQARQKAILEPAESHRGPFVLQWKQRGSHFPAEQALVFLACGVLARANPEPPGSKELRPQPLLPEF